MQAGEWDEQAFFKALASEGLRVLMIGRRAMVVFGIATALGTMGINISALVAGLGLTGFALGFAFRDVLSNLLAGILLLLFRPFGVGDHISVTGLEGDVTRIDLRYTVIRQPTAIVLMPNANLFTNPILVTIKEPDKPVAESTAGIHAGANSSGTRGTNQS